VKHSDSNKSALINQEDAVLVMIDMQDKLFRAMSEKEILMSNVLKLIKFSRILKLPVVVTEQQKLGNTLYVIREQLPDMTPICKSCFNCFGADGFSESLRRLNRKTLIVIGTEAHICVTQTVLHALSDYHAHVVSDAVSSRNPNDCAVALQRMAAAGATITTSEMVMYELLKEAGTDTFREALELVK